MSLQILRPLLLLLIPLLIFLLLFSSKYMMKMNKLKRRAILILRSAVIIFLVFAMADISLKLKLNIESTIFLVDASDSMKNNIEKIDDFIVKSQKTMKKKNEFGVIVFGKNLEVDKFLSKTKNFSNIDSKINGTYTNIENGINGALSLFPENSSKRIVLLTDGEENTGDMVKTSSLIKDLNVDFKVLKFENTPSNEVAIENVELPKNINLGSEFSIIATINSNVATKGKLEVYSGKEKKFEKDVEIQTGNNQFIFRDTAENGGFRSYRVVITPEIDTEVKNNEYVSFTNVTSKPGILLIGNDDNTNELEKILNASSMDYKKINAIEAPRSLEEMSNYKSIITCNVHKDDLNEGFLSSLESYVKDFAGGFIAVGGEDSFALGDYKDTSLEKVLPVYMDMKGKKEIPKMAIMLVIDRSGSMSDGSQYVSKLSLAKDAAIRAVDTLRDDDEIGVLAFDDSTKWIVERQVAKDKEDIVDAISGISMGGGTSILPALKSAVDSISKSDAQIKHIILLTDGQAEKDGYDEVTNYMNENKITLSTVAVGQGSDIQLLNTLANSGKGRYYYTDINSDIPRIFAKEVYMSANVYLKNKEFFPVINSNEVLTGLSEGVPSLYGYIGSSIKETAQSVFKSDEDDPVLSIWQYGLGKTVAWNSDMNGKWSKNYVSWEDNLKLWQNLINYTIENYDDENVGLKLNVDGSNGVINYTSKESSETKSVKAVIVGEDNDKKEIVLNPSSPSEYSGEFDIDSTGVYLINVQEEESGNIIKDKTGAIGVQYSPEYKLQKENNKLNLLVNDVNGKFIKDPSEIFSGDLEKSYKKINLTLLFLTLAIVIFMLDVANRRLNINYEKYSKKLKYSVKNNMPEFKKPSLNSVKNKNTKPLDVNKATIKENIPKGESSKKDNKKEEAKKLDTSSLLKKKDNRND